MHKNLTAGLLLLSLGATSWAQDIQVTVDGTPLSFDQPPVMQGGRVMVPLRGIFEGLGAEVRYDARLRSIKATKGATVVELSLGSREAAVNGAPMTLDVPADTLGGRTMVPLRFVSEALGAQVKWSPSSRSVAIASTSDPGGEPSEPPTGSADKPKIDQIISNSTRPLKAGELLEVIATGDSGCQARFEILGTRFSANMLEARPGRYEGKLRIESGMVVEQGVILVHLQRGEQETLQEAGRTVTLEGQAGSSTPPENNPSLLEPSPNSVVNTLRPNIRAEMPGLQRQSLRFFVDGIDFTSQVQRQGRALSWTPGYDLNPGVHQVLIEGVNRQNQALRENWSFNIQPGSVSGSSFWSQPFPSPGQMVGPRPTIGAQLLRQLRPNSLRFTVDGVNVSNQSVVNANQVAWTPGYDLAPGNHLARLEGVDTQGFQDVKEWNFSVGGGASGVSVTNVAPGSAVPANFALQGNAPPNSEVLIQIGYRKRVGIFYQNRTLQASGIASPSGQYLVVVSAQDVDSGTTMDINISARANGNVLGQTQIQLRRN